MPNLDSPRDVIYVLADIWFSLKTALEVGWGTSDATLHVVGGLALQIACAFLLRLSVSSMWPWILVLLVQLVNEAADLHWGGISGDGSLGASTIDTALTMLLPTALLLFARARRNASKGELDGAAGHCPTDQRMIQRPPG